MRGDPFSPAEQAILQEMLDTLLALDEATGGWTSKVDARQTGFSLHIKFDKKVDVGTSIRVANCFDQGTEKLCQIVDRVLGQIKATAEATS